MVKETNSRSLLKTFSWRVLATLVTMTLIYLFVGRVKIAMLAGGIDVVIKTILYYGHERLWNRIDLGRSFQKKEEWP